MRINKNIISSYVRTNNISIRSLEDQASLTRNAIFNIMNDKSKNPTIDTLVKIAEAINCTIDDLINFKPQILPQQQTNDIDISIPYSPDLFKDAVSFTDVRLGKNPITLPNFVRLISTIYKYSYHNNHKSLDSMFAEWIITDFLSKKTK